MSIISKVKYFLQKECLKEAKCTDIHTIEGALSSLKTVWGRERRSSEYVMTKVLEQSIYWIDTLQKDMDIIKGDKLRSMLADLTGIKQQISLIAQEIKELQDHKCSNKEQKEADLISQVKDTLKKIKKTKEKDHGNK